MVSIFYGSTEWVNKNCVSGQINLPVLWGNAGTLTMRSSDHVTVKIGDKMAVDTQDIVYYLETKIFS